MGRKRVFYVNFTVDVFNETYDEPGTRVYKESVVYIDYYFNYFLACYQFDNLLRKGGQVAKK